MLTVPALGLLAHVLCLCLIWTSQLSLGLSTLQSFKPFSYSHSVMSRQQLEKGTFFPMYFLDTRLLLSIMDQEWCQRKSQGEFCLDVKIKPNNEQLKLGITWNIRYLNNEKCHDSTSSIMCLHCGSAEETHLIPLLNSAGKMKTQLKTSSSFLKATV